MRKLMIALVIASLATPAIGQTVVRGHIRKDGTYVPPHVRTAPNSSTLDNWSTKGNTNPYNGRRGTDDALEVPRVRTQRTTPFGNPRLNPRSGRYETPCYSCGDED